MTKFSGSFLLQAQSEVRSGVTGHTQGMWLDLVQISWSEGKSCRSSGMVNDKMLSAAGTYSSVAVFFPTIYASVIDTGQVVSFGIIMRWQQTCTLHWHRRRKGGAGGPWPWPPHFFRFLYCGPPTFMQN